MEEIVFPNQIRQIRRLRGYRMKEVADVLNMSLSAISKIEKGYRRLNGKQLTLICEFLNCEKEKLFINNSQSNPDVITAWTAEQIRRHQINEQGGLKTLGAGLRYIRGQKRITLAQISQTAQITLSVYHRIEMGQREVSEFDLSKIAYALGYDLETLQACIYDLDQQGKLTHLKKKKPSGIFQSKGGYNDIAIDQTAELPKVPIYASDFNQKISIKFDQIIDEINYPDIPTKHMFGILLGKDVLSNLFPINRTYLVFDKSKTPTPDDLCLIKEKKDEFILGKSNSSNSWPIVYIYIR